MIFKKIFFTFPSSSPSCLGDESILSEKCNFITAHFSLVTDFLYTVNIFFANLQSTENKQLADTIVLLALATEVLEEPPAPAGVAST